MQKTFNEVKKDLETAQQKLSATLDPKERRIILRDMGRMIQELESKLPVVRVGTI